MSSSSSASGTHAPQRPPDVIKKYANRRLYNTATSSYVTLSDLATMVRQGEDFVVVDARTNADITRLTLSQIVMDEEEKSGQNNLLPIGFLRQLISFYGGNMQWFLPFYLEQSLRLFAANQEQMRKMFESALGTFPFGSTFQELNRKNLAAFSKTFNVFAPFSARQGAAAQAETGTQSITERVIEPAPEVVGDEVPVLHVHGSQACCAMGHDHDHDDDFYDQDEEEEEDDLSQSTGESSENVVLLQRAPVAPVVPSVETTSSAPSSAEVAIRKAEKKAAKKAAKVAKRQAAQEQERKQEQQRKQEHKQETKPQTMPVKTIVEKHSPQNAGIEHTQEKAAAKTHEKEKSAPEPAPVRAATPPAEPLASSVKAPKTASTPTPTADDMQERIANLQRQLAEISRKNKQR